MVYYSLPYNIAGSYRDASNNDPTTCTLCPSGQTTTGSGISTSPDACFTPVVLTFDASVYNASDSCESVLAQYNAAFSGNLTIRQQVQMIGFTVRVHVECIARACYCSQMYT